MRTVVLILALVLCTCALGAGAQAPPAYGAAMDKAAFLDSLETPRPVFARSGSLPAKSTCNIQLTCDNVNGYMVSCSSSSGDCHSSTTSVTCDGVQHNCPICYIQKTCCDESIRECWGWSSCSFMFPRSIKCDGDTYTCPPLTQCNP
jgi:hypothetical protein